MPVTTINDYVQITLAKNHTRQMDSLVTISQKLVERMNEERPDAAIDFTRHDLVEANRSKAELLTYKAKIADNLSAVSKAKGAIEWTSLRLNEMLTDLQALSGADAETRAAAAAAFKDDLDFINSKVDGANQKIGYRNVNLVGNTSPPDFTVDNLHTRTSDRGGDAFIEGTYLGSRYNIEDGGNVWRFDENTDAYIQYASDGTKTAAAPVAKEGLTIDSYDPDTGAVVLGGSGSLSGTLVRGGIGVLGAEFYGDFATDADVERAIDDVTAAIAYVSTKGAPIKASATLVQASNRMVQNRISQLSSEISRITQEELSETQAEAKAARLKVSLAINNINIMARQNAGMIENLMTLTEGRQSAVGVFGMLGY